MIYRLIYCNKDGVEARVDIQKGSSTPVIEVEGTERPFILSYNNDKGNKSGMFLSSSADIEIYETTDFNIDNLKTSNETELSVTHYIDNVVSWQGFIIPDFFSIEVRSNPVITMTASDRLGTLKNVTLDDLPSTISLRELAILCLNKTGLTLPLRTMADFNNGTGINDFFNSKILTQRLLDTKGRSISCYDILSSILTASNSFLVQRSGAWHIINKIQHEAGSGKLYTGATSFINWSDVIFNFSDISTGGRRTIIPVASSVGVFHEFGGGRIYPENYDFSLDLTGWASVNGFVAVIDNRKVDNFVSGTGVIPQEWTTDPVFGDPTEKKYLVNDNYGINYDLADKPYLRSSNIPVTYPNLSQVKVNVEVNATGPYIDSETYRGETNFAVIANNGVSTLHLTGSGTFEPLYGDPFLHKVLFDGDTHLQAVTSSRSVNGVLAVQDGNLSGYNITIRIYGYTKGVTGGRFLVTTLVNSVAVTITDISDEAKGTLYKTERTDNYTKAHDIDTSLFADYLTTGLNGYFYSFPIDDTSLIYNSNNELTSKWTAYNDPEQLPLLQHITRQRSRLFSVAHDLLSAEIEVNNFDPLAIFVACGIRHTVVSAQFDFFKSNLSVELEEIAFQNATVRDFIYSYFGDGESGIKSIGGISGGSGGGSTGGGLTPEQLEILSFWKKDPDNPNTIFTEMNAYSKLELSAYGVGDGDGGGGGGGSDYERLDTWASYDSSKAEWVLSAFLGNDLNTRVTAIDGRVTDLENSSGGGGDGSVTSVGISVPTGLSVSNSPITSSGVIEIGLETGYSIPATAKQGQWDTAYGWGDFREFGLGGYYAIFDLDNQKHNSIGFTASITANLTMSYGGVFKFGENSGYVQLYGEYDSKQDLHFRRYRHGVFDDWRKLWHSGDFTSTEITNWREVRTWWQTVGQYLKRDATNQALYTNENFYSTKELSAYGIGSGGGGGGSGIIETVYGYSNLGQTFNNSTLTDTFNAYTINRLHERVQTLEQSSGGGSVTSVGISVPTGLSVANSPITSSGVIAIGLQAGYSIPTTVKQGQWDTAYSHSQAEHQSIIDGIGFVKADGKTLSYDNSTYSLSTHLHTGTYEPVLGSPTANGYLLSSTNAGVRSWVAPYSLPTASAAVLGGVKIGANVSITSGVISVHNPITLGTANGLSLSTQVLSLALATTSASGALSATDKTYIDLLKTFFEYDSANNAIKALKSLYSTGELSAYGVGDGGGGGGSGIIETVYGYGNLGQTFNNSVLTDTFNAYTINQINTRLVSVENGSATTVNTTGTGNAITSISKSGNAITANKGSTFSLSTHTHDTLYKPIGYTPTWGEITGKPSTFAPSTHSHSWSQITSKPSTFAPSAHTLNSHSNVTITSIASGEILKWNGTDWVNNTLSEAGISASSHSHSWSQITSKPSTFTPSAHTHSNISITAGTGLSGGGDLSASRTLSIASTYAPNTSTNLGTSKNLNNYQTAGFYHQTANANATTALNYPVARAGALLVETAAGVIQTYKEYNSSNVYVRGYYSTTWTAWRKLVNASDSIPWARISGAPTTATTHPTWAQVTGKPSTFTPSSHTHSNITITAGNGLTGGGTLAETRTITLGTPSNITVSSTNSVGTSNHTHSLALGGTASQYLNGATSLVTIPTVTAGNGLTGGGQLTASRTLTLGTPSTLTAETTNGVTTSSHTHAITTTSVGAANTIIQTDATGGTKLNNLIVGGDWKLEQVGTELQLKYNDVVAQRFLLDGSIVGLGEITAYGATTGGEGVSLLRTGGTMTGNLTMSADIIMNSGRAIGVSNLPLKLLGNALTYNASNVLTEANTATQIKMGNGWTIEQTVASLTIRKDGVIKGTFNA